MNILKCRECRKGRLACVFLRVTVNENGRYEFGDCMVNSGDFYNIYPESNSDGNVIFQDDSLMPTPWKHGLNILWESIRPSDHGMTFSPRRHPESSDMDPRYITSPYNIPTGHLGPGTVGDIFGKDNLSLVSASWSLQRFIGIPKVERCSNAVYGTVDVRTGMTTPNCIKDYSGSVLGFKNYTNMKPRQEMHCFALELDDEDLREYCNEWFDEEITIDIIKAVSLIRAGHFKNIYDVIGDSVPKDVISRFLRVTSFRSISTIYPKYMNLDRLMLLYSKLGDSEEFDQDVAKIYRCNLINYLLNNPKLANIIGSATNTFLKYPSPRYQPRYAPHERFWIAAILVKRAYIDGLVPDNMMLPKWIAESLEIINGKRKEISDDEIEARHLGLDKSKFLYPEVQKIETILSLKQDEINGACFKKFKEFLKAGIRWSELEIVNVWERFKHAFKRDNPKPFWDFMTDVLEMSQQEANEELALEKEDNGAEVIGFSSDRAFARNILERMVSKESWLLSSAPLPTSFEKAAMLEPDTDQSFGVDGLFLAKANTKEQREKARLIAEGEDDLLNLLDSVDDESEIPAGPNSLLEGNPDYHSYPEHAPFSEVDPYLGETHTFRGNVLDQDSEGGEDVSECDNNDIQR